MLDCIDDGGRSVFAVSIAIIVLTISVGLGGFAVHSIEPLMKDVNLPSFNPDSGNPGLNKSESIVFTVTPSSNPRYWRTNAYDKYTGSGWAQHDKKISEYISGTLIKTDVSGFQSKEIFTYTITMPRAEQGYIATSLNTIRVFNLSQTTAMGKNAYDGYYIFGQASSYSFTMEEYEFTDETLAESDVVGKADAADYYTLPETVTARVHSLSLNITSGATTPYRKAVLIASFLKSADFKFTRFSNPPPGADFVDWFLFEGKEGSSLAFASAFVVMARCNDLPARLATGYALGHVENGVRVVKAAHAHAWPEVWFADVGWRAFEVTGSNYRNETDVGTPVDGCDKTIIGGGTGGGTGMTSMGKPDLTFSTEFIPSTDRILRSETCTIFATIKNIGNGSSVSALVRFYEKKGTDFSRVFDSRYIPALPPKTEITIGIRWNPAVSGIVAIEGCIDPHNAIDELNENNNNKSVSFKVINGIDLALQTDSLAFTGQPVVVDSYVSLMVCIYNNGNLDADNARVYVYDDDTLVGYLTGIYVKVFDKEIRFLSWQIASSGPHFISVQVMPEYGVNDIDWTNNNVTKTQIVKDKLELCRLIWDDKNGDQMFGEGDTVTVHVRNHMSTGMTVAVSLVYLTQNITSTAYISKDQNKGIELRITFNYIEYTERVSIYVYPLSDNLLGERCNHTKATVDLSILEAMV